MKRICTLLIAVALAGVMHPCFGEESQEKPKAEEQKTQQLFGTVAQVSFVKGFIVVFSDAGYLTVQVRPDTLITQGFGKISVSDINNGDSVIVRYYSPEPETHIAVSIRVSKGE
ncbi:MAG: hypothetical protein PHT59_01585 [Candidatus Omnitrophica bacterium]|nr:hypothetical protein [Candidatus Omnitrophota bacterium]